MVGVTQKWEQLMMSGGCRIRWEALVCLLELGWGSVHGRFAKGFHESQLGCLTPLGPAKGPGFSHGEIN